MGEERHSDRYAARQPRCPKCRSTSLTLVEEHIGTGHWGSDEWHIEADGVIVTTGDGWAGSTPTGRWFFECEDCGHDWRKRRPSTVVPESLAHSQEADRG